MDQNSQEVKVILLGDVGVGKSNIAFRFTNDFFLEESEPTLNSNFMSKTFSYNGTTSEFKIWDTAGNEKFRSMTSLYFKRAKVALIVFDITRKDTFYGITSWIKQLNDNAPSDILIALVGNKTDLVDQEQLSMDEIAAFAKDNAHFFSMVSAKDGSGIEGLFQKIVLERQMIDLGIPPSEMEQSIKIKKKQFSELQKKRVAGQTPPCCP